MTAPKFKPGDTVRVVMPSERYYFAGQLRKYVGVKGIIIYHDTHNYFWRVLLISGDTRSFATDELEHL